MATPALSPLAKLPKKQALFFLFTDWDQAQPTLDAWQPFAAIRSADRTTIRDITWQINASLEVRLSGVVDSDDRIYFSHTKRGIQLIQAGDPPNWEFMQGAIVDLKAASPQSGNSEKLSKLAKGLGRKAPAYVHSRLRILICLLPSARTALPSILESRETFKLCWPADSGRLVSDVCDWLTELNKQIEDDRINAPQELREAVEKFLEEILA